MLKFCLQKVLVGVDFGSDSGLATYDSPSHVLERQAEEEGRPPDRHGQIQVRCAGLSCSSRLGVIFCSELCCDFSARPAPRGARRRPVPSGLANFAVLRFRASR